MKEKSSENRCECDWERNFKKRNLKKRNLKKRNLKQARQEPQHPEKIQDCKMNRTIKKTRTQKSIRSPVFFLKLIFWERFPSLSNQHNPNAYSIQRRSWLNAFDKQIKTNDIVKLP
jgi:hypothetical protein